MLRAEMLEVVAAFALVGLAWLWFDSLRARESAVRAARLACHADGVQLLDDTVALASIGLLRVDGGQVALKRCYRFEFSDTGDNRLDGSITMVGCNVHALYLEPHGTDAAGHLRIV
jgi:hypothetical protein